MEPARLNGEEIDRRGYEHYETRIRSAVETEENIGKIVVIDAETGDYEIAEDGLTAGRHLQARHPDAAMLALRIGYDAVYSFGGGALTRTKQ